MWLMGFFACLGFSLPETLEIPAPCPVDADVVFEDLDGDGRSEVWVLAQPGRLFFREGGGYERRLREWSYPPIDLEVRPIWDRNRWVLAAWDDGIWLTSEGGGDWKLAADFRGEQTFRPGLPPLRSGDWVLMPTFQGYLVAYENCVWDHLKLDPVVSLRDRAISMGFPLVDLTRSPEGLQLCASPALDSHHQRLKTWRAELAWGRWNVATSETLFPPNLDLVRHAWGDLNGDLFEDLVLLARPLRDFSLFEELTLAVILGKGDGQLDSQPLQVVHSQQNLWQEGPLVIEDGKLRCFYYKGLVRGIITVDTYSWSEDGFLNPRPHSHGWRVKKADRSVIFPNHDLDGDGCLDLLLMEQGRLLAHLGQCHGEEPFDGNQVVLLTQVDPSETLVSLTLGSETEVDVDQGIEVRENTIKAGRGLAVVHEARWHRSFIWKLEPRADGSARLTRWPR